MKKSFYLLLTLLFVVGLASTAQAQIKTPKRHYINFGYIQDQEVNFNSYYVTNDVGDKELVPAEGMKADWGASAEFGSTFFMHKKPIVGMLRVGLDFSYLDLQYAQFKSPLENRKAHFANIGMQVGPSLSVTPLNFLTAKAYVHYAPSFAAFSDEEWENVRGGYAGYLTYGVQVSLKFVTLGYELRSCTTKFHEISTDDESGDIVGEKITTKLPNSRIIVGFRF